LSALSGLALQLVLYFLIANKVDPESLGHYFLASALVFIPAGIIEYSFVSSLIHTEAPDDQDFSAVFRINLKMVALFILVGGLLAVALASYYSIPILINYYFYLAPLLILMAFTSVQNAGLKKELRMRTYATTELTSLVVSFIVTAAFLLAGYGVIAIILGQLAKYLVGSVLLSVYAGYIKLSVVPADDIRKNHWDYGQYILAEKTLGVGFSQMDTFLIHHFLGAEVLGIYDLLKRMVLRPLLTVYGAIEQVVFPLLCNTENTTSYRAVFISFIRTNYIFLLTLIGLLLTNYLLQFFPESYQSYDYVFKLIILLAVSMMIFNPVDIVAYSLDKTKKYFYWILSYSMSF